MAGTDNSREKQAALARRWYLANRQRHAAKSKAWKDDNKEKRDSYNQKWAAKNPEVKAYIDHKSHAKSRGISFLLTFDEWWAIWDASGRFEQRGFRKGQYVMARFADQGAYAVGNVRICTASENAVEREANLSNESRRRRADGGTQALQRINKLRKLG